MAEIVVDPSVAGKWVLEDEQHREQALWLRGDLIAKRHGLVVPAIWDYEIASVLSKAVSTRRLSFLRFPATTVALPPPTAAFENAMRFRRSVIDSFYLALAEERGCDFWTDDRKLVRAVSTAFPFVRWIGDYPRPPAGAPNP